MSNTDPLDDQIAAGDDTPPGPTTEAEVQQKHAAERGEKAPDSEDSDDLEELA